MYSLLHESDILVRTDRQRRDFDPIKMQELSLAIGAKGLLHAIVVREANPDDPLESNWHTAHPAGKVLVAGESRIRAVKDVWVLGGKLRYDGQEIPEGFLPYTNLGDLSPLEAEEAELEENLRRTDLTWQEQAQATAKLHRIRSAQAASAGIIHTVADTTAELNNGKTGGSYQQAVRLDITVARHLDNPAVAKAKTVDEAYKILKKQEDLAKFTSRAAEIGKTFSSDIHEAFCVDCLEWMSRPEAVGQFDVILTDPPYGMNADKFGDGAGRMGNNEHHYDDSPEAWAKLMQRWAPLAYRVAKPQAHAYVFCDFDNFHTLKAIMQEAGWYVFRTPFISYKPGSGRVPLPDRGPRRQYELCLYAIKGGKATTGIYPDVISSIADPDYNHGAQKSVSLYENLLQRSVRAGDVVLDSFSGTGTIFPAAQKFHVKAVGLELNPASYGMGLDRLRKLAETPAADSLDDELAKLLG